MILIRVEVQTRNFDFFAYGKTKKEAKEVLKKVWEKHVEQYGGSESVTMTTKEFLTDLQYYMVEAGAGFRDGERLI